MASNFFVVECPRHAEPFDQSFGADYDAALAWMHTRPVSSDLELFHAQDDDGDDGPFSVLHVSQGVTVAAVLLRVEASRAALQARIAAQGEARA